MAGETIITVVGNLTRDPELRTVGNGSTVVNFTIASSTRTFNRNTNQWDDGDTLFLNCSAWDSARTSMATNIANSLSKGMRVIAQGRLTQRSYQAQDGSQRSVVELRVDEIGPALSRATAQVTRQTSSGFNGGQQGGGGAHGEIDKAEEIGAGGGPHAVGDGAAEGDPPDGGGADDRQQGQGLRDAALDRAEGDGRQYQRKGGVGSRDDSGGSELPQRAILHIHFSFGCRRLRH